MKPDTILRADLLDIIFENRNKDYGAYELRRYYPRRLKIALCAMAAFCCLFFCVPLLKIKGYEPFRPPIIDRGVNPTIPPDPPKPGITHILPPARKISPLDMPPRIVDSVIINKPLATNLPVVSSLHPGDTSSGQLNEGRVFPGGGNTANNSPAATEGKIDKTTPRESGLVDIMPQYPGGTKALLDFLKKNLEAPEDIEDGEMISVKVRFVVNYDGKLQGFDILQSGGAVFDDEVIRVLKKMPPWIPGKSNGENVSVYYVVPVKFTNNN